MPKALLAVLLSAVIAASAPVAASAGNRLAIGVHRKLTEQPTNDVEPTASPDGTLLAFTGEAPDGRRAEIYVLELATGSVRRVTYDGGNRTPMFARADGSAPCDRILFSGHWERDPNGTILAIDAAGTGRQFIGPAGGLDGAEGVPDQLPDGRIVYDTQDPPRGIWCMNADGSGAARLTGICLQARRPRVSPDGTLIAYHTQSGMGTCADIHVCEVPAPGSVQVQERRITSESAPQGYPSFSPDGQWIVYQSKEDGGSFFDIWALRADNPAVRQQLTVDDVDQTQPCWLPDGSGIVYQSCEGGAAVSNLWLLELRADRPTPTGTRLADKG
jgi:Tol biopolymer transport system component